MSKRILEKFIREVVEREIGDSDKRIDRFIQGNYNKYKDDGIDIAVAKSQKRRQEFRDQWKDKNPPIHGKVPDSVHIRESNIRKIKKHLFLEQATAVTDPNAVPPTPEATAAPATAPATAPPAPATAAPAMAAPAPAMTPPAGGAPAPMAAPAPGVAGLGTTDAALSPDVGSPGGIGAAPMGGAPAGAPAAGGDMGGAAPAMPGGEEGGEMGAAAPEEKGGDPISGMVDNAMEIVEKTKDVPTILKAMKADIQNKFEKPEHALGIVKALYDTGDTTLMSVAARLFQFIKASR